MDEVVKPYISRGRTFATQTCPPIRADGFAAIPTSSRNNGRQVGKLIASPTRAVEGTDWYSVIPKQSEESYAYTPKSCHPEYRRYEESLNYKYRRITICALCQSKDPSLRSG